MQVFKDDHHYMASNNYTEKSATADVQELLQPVAYVLQSYDINRTVKNRSQSSPVQKDLTVAEAGSCHLNLVFSCLFSPGSLKLQCKNLTIHCIIANLYSKDQKTRKPYLNRSHLEAVSHLQEATHVLLSKKTY